MPQDKIRSRRDRSFQQLGWFLPNVDRCYIFDNSTGLPKLIAEKIDDSCVVWEHLPLDLEAALEKAGVRILFYSSP